MGRVIKERGVKGEVRVEILTDYPDRLAAGRQVWLRDRLLSIEMSHPQRDHYVVKFAGIDGREDAAMLRDTTLEIPISEARPLPEGEYYWYQILGLDVYNLTGEPVGRIEEILPTGSNDVYVVRGRHGEVLVPAIADVVESIDLEKSRMTIRIIDGLL